LCCWSNAAAIWFPERLTASSETMLGEGRRPGQYHWLRNGAPRRRHGRFLAAG
jgi:hypothetical protein